MRAHSHSRLARAVRDPAAALAEVARVLRPGGAFVFVEHVAADGARAPLLAAAQRALDPAQQLLAGGCHLTRRTGQLIASRCARGGSSSAGLDAEQGDGDLSSSGGAAQRAPALFAALEAFEAFDAERAWPITPHVAGVARK